MEMAIGAGDGDGGDEVALLMIWPQAVLNDDYLSATSRHASC